jgi:hypothetical protein
MQYAVGVAGDRGLGLCHQQAARHAEVHDPLQIRQVKDNVFAYPVDELDALPGQLGGHLLRRRLERFGFLAEPGGLDAVSAETLIDPAGYRFNFRQFRHGSASCLVSFSQVLGRYPASLYHQDRSCELRLQ